jgi:hypothetical protein
VKNGVDLFPALEFLIFGLGDEFSKTGPVGPPRGPKLMKIRPFFQARRDASKSLKINEIDQPVTSERHLTKNPL